MPNFSDLPPEIWLLISQYMSESDLSTLKSVNSFFLDCWLKLRWSKSIIVRMGTPDQFVQFERMVDPFIAPRVKTLSIWFDSEIPESSINHTPVDTLSVLLRSLPLFHKLTFLHLQQFQFQQPMQDFGPIFRTVVSCPISRTLRTLSLGGDVDAIATIAEHSAPNTVTCFQSLSTLRLGLRPIQDSNIGKKSLVALAPFLLSVAPTLQRLEITGHLSLDLSPLFDALFQTFSQTDSPVLFPNLTSFLIGLRAPLIYPRSLLRLLSTQSDSLHHLQLVFHFFGRHDSKIEQILGEWLSELVRNCEFPFLHTLDITPSTSSTGLSASMALIKQSARSLSSLTIFDHYLQPHEIEQLLDALTATKSESNEPATTRKPAPSTLKMLNMSVTHLSVAFLDLLARKLPQLHNLHLYISEVVGSEQYTFYELLRNRRQDDIATSAQDPLHTWKLRNLTIWQSWKLMGDVMHAVADVVPSLVIPFERKEE